MLIAVPFVVIITGFVIIGLASTSQSQSSAWVSWLNQNLGIFGTSLALGLVAATDLARWATHKLGQHFAGIERLTVAWLSGLAAYAEQVLTFPLLWPVKLVQVTLWLIDVEIPRLIRATVGAAPSVVHAAIPRITKIEKIIYRFPKLSRKQAEALVGAAVATYVAPYLYPLRWLRSHFHAMVIALEHAVPVPRGWTPTQIRRWARKAFNDWALTGAFVGAVALALKSLDLGWLRCSSLRRLGNRVGCGGFGLLEAFFADAFEVFVVTNLCTFIYLLQRAAEELRPEMLAFVDLENALINCHGNKKPPYLEHTTADPPPVLNPLSLAA